MVRTSGQDPISKGYPEETHASVSEFCEAEPALLLHFSMACTLNQSFHIVWEYMLQVL